MRVFRGRGWGIDLHSAVLRRRTALPLYPIVRRGKTILCSLRGEYSSSLSFLGAFVEGDGDLFGADLVGAALDDYVYAASGYFRWDQREGYVGF